ncbi:PAS domain S-box protein, partial [Deinococcus pimensis]|uniref:PAS domain S-box protein n=1 Tax=Deinococcus pimensis TaxID=309888 RepID=UPI0005EAD35A
MSETQASEARLRLALRAARQGAWEYDLRTGRGVRSPELMHLMNVHNDQPSLADFLSNVAPEDRPLVLATFQKLRCGEQDDSVLQFRYVRDDGGVIWVEQHTFVERGADGEALRLYGVTRDVTEHKRIEAELQALNATLEERVRERSRALEERTAALDAFVAFTERVGSEWGARELARGAVDVLRATLGDVSVAYYERQGDCWRAVVWSEDIPEDALAMIRAGVPVTQPRFHEASLGAGAYFMQDWDAEREHLDDSRMYGAGALYPYFTDGEPAAMLNIATMRASSWSVRERAIFSAVGRSLALALERGEQTRRTKRQNAELDARTRALEGFADLSRDLALEQDPVTLVGRAQDIVVSLLPSSICTFYELDAALWTLRSHRGEFRNPDLLAAFLRGLPRGRTPNVDRPFDTGEPYYQDRYDPATTA